MTLTGAIWRCSMIQYHQIPMITSLSIISKVRGQAFRLS